MLAEQLVDDLRYRHILEDPAVAGAGKQPEGRHEPDLIECQSPPEPPRQSEARDNAVDRRFQPGAILQPEGGIRPEQIIRPDRGIGRSEFEIEGEAAGNIVLSTQRYQQNVILPQSSVNTQQTSHLRIGIHSPDFPY